MPRTRRVKGPECTYHIIVRGNNRQNIFNDSFDRIRYLNTIKRFKIKYDFKLYAYVLMDNHIHLIIDSNGEDISKIMQSISISYTYYFNKKFDRTGHLFQDRFKSIIVEEDNYIVNLSKYIHNNPVRAGIARDAGDYSWSSCRTYISESKDEFGVLDVQLILGYFSNNLKKSRILYLNYLLNGDYEVSIKQQKTAQIQGESADTKQKVKNRDTVSVDNILTAVSRLYRLPVDDILLKNNKRNSDIRHECLYIVRLKSKESVKNIGKIFGGVSPSSVSYGISKIVNRMMKDSQVYGRISNILNSIA